MEALLLVRISMTTVEVNSNALLATHILILAQAVFRALSTT